MWVEKRYSLFTSECVVSLCNFLEHICHELGFNFQLDMSNDEQLVVTSVHLYPLENGKLHHTNKFEALHRDNPTVILRRGQPFHLVIGFSGRSYDANKDFVQLVFSHGKRRVNPTSGTHVTLLKQWPMETVLFSAAGGELV
jgi:hypothetical protein